MPSIPTWPTHLALRLLHVRVAGTHDHVDRPHRLRAVRECGDRLRPAHPVDLGDLAQHARGEDHRVCAASRPGRGADGDLPHTRRPRGDGAHHDGGRIRRAPARHVDGCPAHRVARRPRPCGPPVARPSPARHGPAPSRPPSRSRSRFAGRSGRRFSRTPDRRLELVRVHAQLIRAELGVVESLGEARDTASSPPLADLLDDLGHGRGPVSTRGRCATTALRGASTLIRAAAPRSRRSRPPSACGPRGWRSGGPCWS